MRRPILADVISSPSRRGGLEDTRRIFAFRGSPRRGRGDRHYRDHHGGVTPPEHPDGSSPPALAVRNELSLPPVGQIGADLER